MPEGQPEGQQSPVISEADRLRAERIRELSDEWIDTLAKNGIMAIEVIAEHGALDYIRRKVLERPLRESTPDDRVAKTAVPSPAPTAPVESPAPEQPAPVGNEARPEGENGSSN